MPDMEMTRKLFSKSMWLLLLAGLAVNVALVWVTGAFGIPLYLDSIGTVIVAALGGVLPGIAVGFFSNCITALISVSPDPMTLYYGFLNVLIAVAAAWLSRRGLLLKWYGRGLAVAIFAVIGGALGSVVTWMLYGFSFGQGISAPLAKLFYRVLHMGEFAAQFGADMCIDIVDKAVTVAAACLALRLLPWRLLDTLPLGAVYRQCKKPSAPARSGQAKPEDLRAELLFRRRSIRTKITLLLVAATTILSVVAMTISGISFKERLIRQYSAVCSDTVSMMLPKLDGGRVDDYLALGEAAEGYLETKQALYDIFENGEHIKYMYVYAIRADGCHVVFDLDADALAGQPVGDVVAFDDSFPYVEQLLAGEEIPPLITDDTYGWLLTVYKPVRTPDGTVATYAAADIDMQEIRTEMYSFCIGIASLLFGVMVVITAFSLWYCDRKLLAPMGVLVEQARDFDFDGSHSGHRVRDRRQITTGDEIEEVFTAMCRTEDTIACRVAELKDKNVEISRMQRNIIYTLANMVENRDGNTGGHIRRTAGYVRLIGEKLLAAGLYPELVSESYLKQLYDSAPLHDIGKVKIPDAVLNKPGRLTAEEFELMKTHTTEGAAILRTSLSDIEDGTWLTTAIDMAEHHHERWDGKGYPSGLAGEAIPLCARIMAVSDVFDALVSVRSYKSAFGFEESMQIIREGAGTQFDPQIAALFEAAAPEVRRIMASE